MIVASKPSKPFSALELFPAVETRDEDSHGFIGTSGLHLVVGSVLAVTAPAHEEPDSSTTLLQLFRHPIRSPGLKIGLLSFFSFLLLAIACQVLWIQSHYVPGSQSAVKQSVSQAGVLRVLQVEYDGAGFVPVVLQVPEFAVKTLFDIYPYFGGLFFGGLITYICLQNLR